jgi:anti-anti-sigma factor
VYLLGRKRGTQVFRAHSPAHPDDETWPGLLMLRTEGRLFFANAPQLAEKMRALIEPAKPSVVVLDLSGVFDIEYSALKRLVEAEQTLREQGVEVWLAALNPEPLEVVRRSTLGEALGTERLFFTVQEAVERYAQRRASGE